MMGKRSSGLYVCSSWLCWWLAPRDDQVSQEATAAEPWENQAAGPWTSIGQPGVDRDGQLAGRRAARKSIRGRANRTTRRPSGSSTNIEYVRYQAKFSSVISRYSTGRTIAKT